MRVLMQGGSRPYSEVLVAQYRWWRPDMAQRIDAWRRAGWQRENRKVERGIVAAEREGRLRAGMFESDGGRRSGLDRRGLRLGFAAGFFFATTFGLASLDEGSSSDLAALFGLLACVARAGLGWVTVTGGS